VTDLVVLYHHRRLHTSFTTDLPSIKHPRHTMTQKTMRILHRSKITISNI